MINFITFEQYLMMRFVVGIAALIFVLGIIIYFNYWGKK